MECQCGECGKTGKMFLHSKCHIGAPTWAVLDQENNELEIICSVCDKPICKFKLADQGE